MNAHMGTCSWPRCLASPCRSACAALVAQVYSSAVRPLVDALMKGHNAFCAAFGQANSGKTFTMSTTRHGGKDVPGMAALAVQDVLDRIATLHQSRGQVTAVSFVRVHVCASSMYPCLPAWGCPGGRFLGVVRRAAFYSTGNKVPSDTPTVPAVLSVAAGRAGSRMQLHVASFEVHNNCVHDLLHSRRVEGVVVDDPVVGPVECGVSRHPIERINQVWLLVMAAHCGWARIYA